MDPFKCNFLDGSRTTTVEDITNRLDQMDFNQSDVSCSFNDSISSNNPEQFNSNFGHSQNSFFANHNNQQTDSPMNFADPSPTSYCTPNPMIVTQQQQPQQGTSCLILIVTNVDSSIFNDKQVQSEFETLFKAYDPNVTFRYLRSFRRVRLDFTQYHLAELARSNLAQYKLGSTEFRCYSAQIIKPTSNNSDGGSDENNQNQMDSTFLNIPKLTKQFLISPPASPPVGWEPVTESSPCIDVQLISALANLVPGTVHEIHQGNESQPGIYVEVCEEPQFEVNSRLQQTKNCPRSIPKTPNPGFCS